MALELTLSNARTARTEKKTAWDGKKAAAVTALGDADTEMSAVTLLREAVTTADGNLSTAVGLENA